MVKKGTAKNPFTLEELQKIVIPSNQVGTIVIRVNKKAQGVDVQKDNISQQELKEILRSILKELR